MDTDKFPCYIASMAPSIHNPHPNNKIVGLPDLEPLKSAVYRLLGREVLDCTRLGRGFFNVVYGLKMADGELLVARVTYNFKTDEKSYQWIQDRLSREILVLKLLKLKDFDQKLPVPQIHVWDFDPSNSVDAPFSVMERLYGEDQWSAWPKLTFEEKIKFVQSLAEAMGRIFTISMPSIGSLEKLTNDNHPVVGRFIRKPSDPRTGGPYATLDEYLAAELQPWSTYDQSEFEFSVPELFERLRILAYRLVPRDDPAMLRPVLVHRDLGVRNVMVNDGIVSGIIDWEYHAALPACLGAEYPSFMRFDGIFDPKYDIQKRIMPTKESWATANEAGPLKSAFREVAGRISMDYVHALDLGEDLRRLLEFATHDLVVCHSWERDMTKSLSI